jgi:hypothetical protein
MSTWHRNHGWLNSRRRKLAAKPIELVCIGCADCIVARGARRQNAEARLLTDDHSSVMELAQLTVISGERGADTTSDWREKPSVSGGAAWE